jgi:hypothetical protein
MLSLTAEGSPPTLFIGDLKRICVSCPHLQQLGYTMSEDEILGATISGLWVSLDV